ncbi:MAG: hypothetical protein V3T88_06890 [Nitrosomonadaceae bacterium]
MTNQMRHSGGLVDLVLELGFDTVKYFEGIITGTAVGFTIDPPAKRLVVNNRNAEADVFLRINDSPATTAVSFVPGDNIKIPPNRSFIMDFDSLTQVSFITGGASVDIDGLIGFKGIRG